MKKSINFGKAEKAKNSVKMRLGTMEILIGHDPALDRAILPEEMKTPSQHCELERDEICYIFHAHEDVSGFVGGDLNE